MRRPSFNGPLERGISLYFLHFLYFSWPHNLPFWEQRPSRSLLVGTNKVLSGVVGICTDFRFVQCDLTGLVTVSRTLDLQTVLFGGHWTCLGEACKTNCIHRSPIRVVQLSNQGEGSIFQFLLPRRGISYQYTERPSGLVYHLNTIASIRWGLGGEGQIKHRCPRPTPDTKWTPHKPASRTSSAFVPHNLRFINAFIAVACNDFITTGPSLTVLSHFLHTLPRYIVTPVGKLVLECNSCSSLALLAT